MNSKHEWLEQAQELRDQGAKLKDIALAVNASLTTVWRALENLKPKPPEYEKEPTIFVIGDTQCRAGEDLTYMKWIAHYIATEKPDIIVHIGDHYDMASLSSYDKGKLSSQGRRFHEDIEA